MVTLTHVWGWEQMLSMIPAICWGRGGPTALPLALAQSGVSTTFLEWGDYTPRFSSIRCCQ